MHRKLLLIAAAGLILSADPSLAATPTSGAFGYHAEGRFGRGDGKWRPIVIERRGSSFRFEFDDKDAPGQRWAIVGDSHTDQAQIVAVRWTGDRPATRPAAFRKALTEAGIDPFDFFFDVPVQSIHRLGKFNCGPPHPDLAGCATKEGAPVYEDSQTTGLRVFELDRFTTTPVPAGRFIAK